MTNFIKGSPMLFRRNHTLKTFDPTCEDLPPILADCLSFLAQKGLEEEGIFRKSGGVTEVDALKKRYLKGRPVNLSEEVEDVHVVSGTLKSYIKNEVSEPFFTYHLYPCYAAIAEMEDADTQVACLRLAFTALPPGSLTFIRALAKLCEDITHHKEVNKMSTDNLAKLFATLVYPREQITVDTMEAVHRVGLCVITLIIDRYGDVFYSTDPPSVPESFQKLFTTCQANAQPARGGKTTPKGKSHKARSRGSSTTKDKAGAEPAGFEISVKSVKHVSENESVAAMKDTIAKLGEEVRGLKERARTGDDAAEAR
eukprot:CAMPEP_0177661818 /NCGR_PEP_ID=MMETSP0447-20121125/18917_1 /TAXON_ID=0 /ORGANISM="Stygamoeba regulata, Strain BSH-02190019" /LENGTH=311 /DNA_ID=CAMNT_0019167257 /DNA_START=242 /DNA_END=1173 /DNA_ORIENTATION=-